MFHAHLDYYVFFCYFDINRQSNYMNNFFAVFLVVFFRASLSYVFNTGYNIRFCGCTIQDKMFTTRWQFFLLQDALVDVTTVEVRTQIRRQRIRKRDRRRKRTRKRERERQRETETERETERDREKAERKTEKKS